MNTLLLTTNRRTLLSLIWGFVLMNMIYADILGMLKPGYLDILEQTSQQLSGTDVLLFAVLMEIPIAMVLLSGILERKANRLANFVAVPLSILWVIGPAMMELGGATPLSYIFFASVEVLAMILLFWIAVKWKE